MSIEFRAATAAEMDQFGALTSYAYGGAFGYGEDNLAMTATRPEWTLCAFDGAALVASYATLPLTARGNGNAVALGGVTTVATAPEYRRRGLLRSITRQALEHQLEAGQSVAALWASQAAIYQRYGYASASAQLSYQIDTRDLQLLPASAPDLDVSRGTLATIMDDVKAVYRRYIAPRTLYLHRSSALWQSNVLTETDQSGPVHGALCRNGDGEVCGYVLYTLRNAGIEHRARNQLLEIRDLVAEDTDAYCALWQFLSRHDLVGRISWQRAPLDDPLPELLSEPRLLHTGVNEGVWLRIVDVAGAMTARGYDCDGEITFSVSDDPLTPWNDGGYHLTVSNGQASIERTGRTTELNLSCRALASIWCGRHRLSQLAHWGFIDGSSDAIVRADTLLATRHLPHCPDHF